MVSNCNIFRDGCAELRGSLRRSRSQKPRASERVEANLLLFKTVVAGDSWGEIAVPVIQKNPATLFIFVGSLLTLVFGVLNVPRLQ